MALSKTIKYIPQGFTEPAILHDAYIRVESINGTKNSLSFSVVAYNKKDNDMEVAQNMFFVFAPEINGTNFIKQAYGYLKTLPEFAGAKDV